jgi:asparagine synthase (glutamine-hydrolysing)
VRKLFNGASLDGDARLVNYFRWIDQRDLMELYSAEFRAALGSVRAEDPMLEFMSDLSPGINRLERMLALEQRFFLTDHNLTYTDKMSMAVGVEVRVPFLDLDLVEFAARIPARFKQRGSEGKWVLKRAMEPYLPRDVIYRPKSGFGAPLRRWMRVELRDLLADVLGNQSLRQRYQKQRHTGAWGWEVHTQRFPHRHGRMMWACHTAYCPCRRVQRQTPCGLLALFPVFPLVY